MKLEDEYSYTTIFMNEEYRIRSKLAWLADGSRAPASPPEMRNKVSPPTRCTSDAESSLL